MPADDKGQGKVGEKSDTGLLKEGLKAIAADAPRTAAIGRNEDPEKTALLGRPEAKASPGAGRTAALQDAMRAVEAALGSSPQRGESAAQAAAQSKSSDVPQTLAIRAGGGGSMDKMKTQVMRGKGKPSRTEFHQEPVVGWLVVIGGPGLGAFRPIFEGNNTIGRAPTQRIPVNFGDDAISAEEQAFLRYDSADRQFLFVPNLAKTNVVAINDQKPTSAVRLKAMDVITMGQTQVVFVPFCGEEFDWSELADLDS
jgi:hypothetical protein